MTWTSGDFLHGLAIAIAVMIIIALYHVIFIVVDLRKISRRFEGITEELETVIMKPLSMTDKFLEWVNVMIDHKTKKGKKQRDQGNCGSTYFRIIWGRLLKKSMLMNSFL